MAIKINNSTIIDDSRNIVNSGIATLNYQGVAEVTIGSTSVGIGSTNKLTITPQVTQTAIGIGTDELITLAPNSGSDNIFQVTNASGSTKHFVVANNGNIGVGTTNPSRKLHVDGDFLVSDGSTEVLEVNGSAGNPLSIQSNSLSPAFDVTGIGSVGIGTTQPSAIFEVVSGGSEVFRISDALSDNYLEIDTDKFVVNSSGNAGIGTTNPQAKLDVNGGLIVSGVSTLGTVQISSGIVTASSGIVTYYGDGSNITGVDAATLDSIDSTSFLRSDAADIKTSGNLTFNDNVRAEFGTDADAYIYHNNTNLILDNTVGNFFIRNLSDDSDIIIRTDNGSGSINDYIRCEGSTGEVQLSHYGSNKLVTKSDGIAVSGIVTAISGIVTYYGDGSGLTNLSSASITLADESSDTTCFPIFATDATGDQTLKTDSSALTYNASTGALSATIFSGFNDRLYVGNLVGTAVTAAPNTLVAVGYNVLKNIDALLTSNNVINSPIAFGENSLTNYSVDFGGAGSCFIRSQIGIGIGCLSTFNLTNIGLGSRTFGTNIVMGYESGRTISGGIDNKTQQNVIVGYQNVYNANFYNATWNSVFGVQSGYNITSGATGNALFGYQCGYNVTTGDYNTLLGYQAGYSVQTGQYNIGIGYSAGQANMTGSRNIVIGYNRDVPNAAGNDQLVIGSNANDWIIGDSSYNVGFGTNNPSGAADPNNTTILNAGIVTANFYYGDGSGLVNLPAADVAPSDGQDFNTGITTTKYASASNDIDGFTAIAVTFPSTAGKTYLVESIHVTNISAGDLYITSRIDYDGGEDVPFTNKVLIPEQGAIDIVDQSFVCNPSDNIRLAAYNGIGATAGGILNGLDCFVTYTEKTDTNYIGIGSTTKSTFTDETVFTSNTNPSVINTIVLTNNSDVADIDASVSMFRGGTIRQGYFVYNLTIPQNSSVQILPKAKRLNATDTIVVNSTSTDLGINVAGKYIT